MFFFCFKYPFNILKRKIRNSSVREDHQSVSKQGPSIKIKKKMERDISSHIGGSEKENEIKIKPTTTTTTSKKRKEKTPCRASVGMCIGIDRYFQLSSERTINTVM